MTAEQLAAIERLSRDGATHASIARAVGCDRNTVAKYRKLMRLPGSSYCQPRVNRGSIMRMHRNRIGTNTIAAELECSPTTVKRYLRGRRVRTPQECHRHYTEALISLNTLEKRGLTPPK